MWKVCVLYKRHQNLPKPHLQPRLTKPRPHQEGDRNEHGRVAGRLHGDVSVTRERAHDGIANEDS